MFEQSLWDVTIKGKTIRCQSPGDAATLMHWSSGDLADVYVRDDLEFAEELDRDAATIQKYLPASMSPEVMRERAMDIRRLHNA